MRINCVNIADLNNDSFQLLKNAVSEKRRKKADHLHASDDVKRCICSETLLRFSLFQEFGESAEAHIEYNKFGKPFITNMERFFYNISHSGNWVVIAYGNSEVGIDIEKIQTGKEIIASRYFTDAEKRYIGEGSYMERAKRFTQIWALKESYLKYLGTGISTSLNWFSVDSLQGIVTNQKGEIQEGLKLKSFLFDSDYYLSVCSIEEEIELHKFQPEDLVEFVKMMQRSKYDTG